MSISVIPMMAEISVGEKNYDTQIVSQTKTITGTIIDETGEPMIGVSVLVQGTTTGASYRFGMVNLHWKFPQTLHW